MTIQANAAGLLQFLWSKFDVEKASDEELMSLSTADEEAAVMAKQLGSVVNGVGSLIVTDMDVEADLQRSGALQGAELPTLLRNIADQVNTIAELSFIGSQANFYLNMRVEARAKSVSRRVQTGKQSSQEGA
ncbi:hypothetical protein AWB71_00687 [Caballeronia peredens]|nr:hypothetical protein AWB71_00687 [Caballeronia peredens]